MARMTMAEVKRLHTAAGGTFFSRGNMKMFRSSIESSLYQGGYFVTSERFGDDEPRVYTVRHFFAGDPLNILPVGVRHGSKDDAVRMIRSLQADAQS